MSGPLDCIPTDANNHLDVPDPPAENRPVIDLGHKCRSGPAEHFTVTPNSLSSH